MSIDSAKLKKRLNTEFPCTIASCKNYRQENSRFCHFHCDDFIMKSLEGLAFARAGNRDTAEHAVLQYIKRHNGVTTRVDSYRRLT